MNEASSETMQLPASPQHTVRPKDLATLTPATAYSTSSSHSPFDTSVDTSSDSVMSYDSNASTVWMPAATLRRSKINSKYAARLFAATSARQEMDIHSPPGRARSSFCPSPIVQDTPASGTFPTLDMTPSTPHHAITTPTTSLHTPRSRSSSDRYIPSRVSSNQTFDLWNNAERRTPRSSRNNSAADEDSVNRNAANPPTATRTRQTMLNSLLRSEMLGQDENESPQTDGRSFLREVGSNAFHYQSPRQAFQDSLYEDATSVVNAFSLTPVGNATSQRLMASPPKRKRRISKVPFKVLDAPSLQDDFYLNLVDWSAQNVLAVGLASCVYLWSACTSKVTKLCDLSDASSSNEDGTVSEDTVTSVSWSQKGQHLAIGTNKGQVQVWDVVKCQKIRDMTGHHARVGTLAWCGPTLASGSRDRLIYLRDVRAAGDFTDRLNHHKQEVCGLKWSFDEPSFLASGGNDNLLHVIDGRNPTQPIHQFSEHSAAVKAIAWSPHQHGLLASGGGTADRCIRFWNALSGTALSKVDTGSQVCNLAWSQNCNEIVSTHGYSLNQIVVWKYPNMSKVATLTGHTYRVLYLAMSPDGSTVVTGAGDETLRFWQVFPGPRSTGKDGNSGLLFPNTIGSVIR